jgi:hypothetical protein
MKKLLLILFCIFFFSIGNVFAVEIAWMQVQHREYGSGKSLNQLSFGLINDRGSYLTDDKNITEVKLYFSRGKEVMLSEVKFGSSEEIYGTYDAKNSQWHYSKIWQFDSWFKADVLESLNPGIYRLVVKTGSGKMAERSFAFNKHVSLPIIDSGTIQLRSDSTGNRIWTWSIPMELGHLAFNHKTRSRASIEIYKNKKQVGYFSIIIPIHLRYVFIPLDLVQIIDQKGDRFELKIQMETRDKNNRTYSKPFIINDMFSTISK